MPAVALQDKSPKLARPLTRGLNSRLGVKSPDHPVWEKLTFRILSHPNIYIYIYIYISLYPRYLESFQREFLREKPQRKTRLIYLQSSHRDSLNFSTFFLSIVKSLRGTLPKLFLTIPIFVRRPFGVQEAVKKGPISYWLMLWSSSGIRQAKEEIGSA